MMETRTPEQIVDDVYKSWSLYIDENGRLMGSEFRFLDVSVKAKEAGTYSVVENGINIIYCDGSNDEVLGKLIDEAPADSLTWEALELIHKHIIMLDIAVPKKLAQFFFNVAQGLIKKPRKQEGSEQYVRNEMIKDMVKELRKAYPKMKKQKTSNRSGKATDGIYDIIAKKVHKTSSAIKDVIEPRGKSKKQANN